MKRFLMGLFLVGLVGIWLGSIAQAQYRPPPGSRGYDSSEAEGEFSDSVDLDRFRKGNIEWDTQELIASGFTALHREHQEILRQLKEIKAELASLKERR